MKPTIDADPPPEFESADTIASGWVSDDHEIVEVRPAATDHLRSLFEPDERT